MSGREMEKGTSTDIAKAMNRIKKELELEPPFRAKCCLAQKQLEAMMTKKQDQKVAKHINIWVLPDDKPQSVDDMTFASLLQEAGKDQTKVDCVCEHLLKSFFGSETVNLL